MDSIRCHTRRAQGRMPSRGVLLGAAALALALPHAVQAQGLGNPTVSDSKVGYIDSALPLSQFRLRYDAGFDNNRPTRAEFFYARSGPGSPGLPRAETSVDHQDVSLYLEQVVRCGLSVFVEVPVRWINPEINDNARGLGDMNAGFKWAFFDTDESVGTFLFRTYAPTGEAGRGLGNHHASLEFGLLAYHRLTDRLAMEGELKAWIPIASDPFAGNIIRYGLGASYDLWRNDRITVAPVVELVGWQVLDGLENATLRTPAGVLVPFVDDAAGDSILNLKLGVRTTLGQHADFYAGYGRSLTGDRFYRDIVRFEVRLFR